MAVQLDATGREPNTENKTLYRFKKFIQLISIQVKPIRTEKLIKERKNSMESDIISDAIKA